MKRGTAVRCVVAVSVLICSVACATTTNGAPPPTTTVVSTQPQAAVPTTALSTTETTTIQPSTSPTTLAPADIHFAGGCLLSQPPAAAQYILSCDGLATVVHAVWSVWNQTEANGTGTYPVKNCQPSCIDGKFTDYPVSMHFDSPIRTKCGMVWGNNVFTFLTKPPDSGKPNFELPVVPSDNLTCK